MKIQPLSEAGKEFAVSLAVLVEESMKEGANAIELLGHIEMYLHIFKAGVHAEAQIAHLAMQIEADASTKQ